MQSERMQTGYLFLHVPSECSSGGRLLDSYNHLMNVFDSCSIRLGELKYKLSWIVHSVVKLYLFPSQPDRTHTHTHRKESFGTGRLCLQQMRNDACLVF